MHGGTFMKWRNMQQYKGTSDASNNVNEAHLHFIKGRKLQSEESY